MFQWLLKADKGADLVSRWFLVYSIMTGAYAWLLKNVPALAERNWAELVLIGIVCSLVTVLLVAASLALIRYFRPIRPVEAAVGPTTTDPPASRDTDEIWTIVSGNAHTLEKLVREVGEQDRKQKAIVQDYQRMVSLEANFEEAKTDIHTQLGKLWAHRSMDLEEHEKRLENVYLALEAILDRERLRHLELQIGTSADKLLVSNDTPKFDGLSWREWEATEEKWRGELNRWCERAGKYLPTLRDTVFETPERSYRVGDWPNDDIFPSASAIHHYRTFMLILRNFNDMRTHIASRVYIAAFERRAADMRNGVRD